MLPISHYKGKIFIGGLANETTDCKIILMASRLTSQLLQQIWRVTGLCHHGRQNVK